MTIGEKFATLALGLEDLCASVRDRFAEAGLATEFFMGEQYAEMQGAGNRVVFVPQSSSATSGGQRMSSGHGATLTETCVALIWGVNGTDDYGFGQYRSAKAIMVEVIGALRLTSGGRVDFPSYDLATETKVIKYGEQYSFTFTFSTPITMVPATVPLALATTTTTGQPRA